MLTIGSLPGRLTIRWWCLLPLHQLPHRLPLQAAQGQLHDQDLPPKHQCEWIYLLGHSARPVVPGVNHLERFVADYLCIRLETDLARVLQFYFRFVRC